MFYDAVMSPQTLGGTGYGKTETESIVVAIKEFGIKSEVVVAASDIN